MFTASKYQVDRNAITTDGRLLRIVPRAAELTIAADAALAEPYRLSWQGAAPAVREDGDAIEVAYTLAGRLRALSSRRAQLTVLLNTDIEWSIELAGGVSGLRADLGGLNVAAFAITGGASDIAVDLPRPARELPLRVEGGVSGAVVRRPGAVPVGVRIDGGVRDLRLDDARFGAMSGVVLKRTDSAPDVAEIALHVRGGARGLTVGARD